MLTSSFVWIYDQHWLCDGGDDSNGNNNGNGNGDVDDVADNAAQNLHIWRKQKTKDESLDQICVEWIEICRVNSFKIECILLADILLSIKWISHNLHEYWEIVGKKTRHDPQIISASS